MDPSRTLCKVENSFNKNEDIYSNIVYRLENDSIMSPRSIRNKLIKNGKKYDIPKTLNIKIEVDKIQKSNIFDVSSYILANIDAIYNFTGQEDGYIKPQIIKDYDFACLNADLGYLKYLQYRLPNSRGFVPCVDLDSVFDKRLLNTNCDEKNIVDYVLSIVPSVDLVLSNKLDYKNNLISALKICKIGGTFISRIDENENNISLYFITANCFETFSLFKPISEDLNESFSYVIGKNYKGNGSNWLTSLDENIFISNDFIEYIDNYYKSLNELKENINKNQTQYDFYKCKAIWNIF